MGEQIQRLAEQFLEVHNAVLAAAAACPETHWRVTPAGEDRTIGVIFHHIVAGYNVEVELIRTVLTQQPIPWLYESSAALDRYNAEYAAQQRDCTKVETIAALEQCGAAAAQFIQGLSDEQLQWTTDHPTFLAWTGVPLPVRVLVQTIIDHPRHHLAEIQAAL